MEFSTVRELVAERWKFTPEAYPALARLTDPTDKARFCLTHVFLHWDKSTGGMAGVLEVLDHRPGEEWEARETAAKLIGKMLVNLSQVANLLGLSQAEIEEGVKKALL